MRTEESVTESPTKSSITQLFFLIFKTCKNPCCARSYLSSHSILKNEIRRHPRSRSWSGIFIKYRVPPPAPPLFFGDNSWRTRPRKNINLIQYILPTCFVPDTQNPQHARSYLVVIVTHGLEIWGSTKFLDLTVGLFINIVSAFCRENCCTLIQSGKLNGGNLGFVEMYWIVGVLEERGWAKGHRVDDGSSCYGIPSPLLRRYDL